MGIGAALMKKDRSKKGYVTELVFFVIVCIFVLFLLLSGRVSVAVTEEAVTMKATYWVKKTVPVEEIREVSYREDFEPGSRGGGFGSWTLSLGRFKNEELGRYTLYAYTKAEAYVVMDTADGYVAFGLKDKEETKRLYEELKALVP